MSKLRKLITDSGTSEDQQLTLQSTLIKLIHNGLSAHDKTLEEQQLSSKYLKYVGKFHALVKSYYNIYEQILDGKEIAQIN